MGSILNPYIFGGLLWTPEEITTALWLDAADAATSSWFMAHRTDNSSADRFYIRNDAMWWGASTDAYDSLVTGWAILESAADGNDKEGLVNAASQGTASDSNAKVHPTTYIGGGKTSISFSYLTGHIAEVIKVPVATTSENVARIQGYLAHKWGLEGNLPGGHPYKSSAPQV